MELGEKLRQARLEAGLSQRQLCGDTITRNMLSQIEHGTARPSMDTLRTLAARLGKPMSFFLQEDTVTSPNQKLMLHAREAFRAGDYAAVQATLEAYQAPDPLFDEEWRILVIQTLLALVPGVMSQGLYPFARGLLERVEELGSQSIYYTPELERRRLLLLGDLPRANPAALCEKLPSLDRELLLRAEAALESGDQERCLWLLGAAEDQTDPRWHYLRGELACRQREYARAVRHFREAEEAFPELTVPKLEQCYRELEDYKMAYFYACKQK